MNIYIHKRKRNYLEIMILGVTSIFKENDFQRKKGETIETFSKRFHFYYYVDFYIYD